jgi:hypothetical protein
MDEVLIPIAFFAMIFGSLYVFFTTRNKERMALIEKGASPELFKAKPGKSNDFLILKLGLFLIGIAIGIFLGNLLSTTTGLNEVASFFSMILLFGGFGLIAAFLIERKYSEK